ncbi:ECF transporter S component [Streptococcus pluranimalium]|uniref:ECF transporter S component n=1 Tax=Streptococcus pluranimalium TaxID=82348 RepID=UPI003F68E0D1
MTNTRKMAYIAILSAISFLLLFFNFPILPAASFLKIDFSVIPILLALLLFDLKSAYVVLLLRTLLKFILNFEGVNTWVGMPINVLALGLFVTVFALVWKNHQTLKTYVSAAVIATIALTLAMLVLNLFFAIPLYIKFAGWPPEALTMTSYIVPAVIPFNLLQGAILSLVFYPAYLGTQNVLLKYQN